MTRKFPALGGSITAMATPFKDGPVDQSTFIRLCQRQIERGTSALVVCGSTGEAASLQPEEFGNLVRLAVTTAKGRVPVIAVCGGLFNDAAAIAIYSLAVAMLAGNRPASTLDGLVTFVRQFGGGLAAGYVAGWAVTRFIPTLRASRLAAATLTLAFAYVTFIVCFHYLGGSGFVSVASAVMAQSHLQTPHAQSVVCRTVWQN